VIYDVIDKLTEIGRCYGMEINVAKTKEIIIPRQQFPVKLMIDQKQLNNVKNKSNPITGLDKPFGFQGVEAPTF
jgi:hypothetical protein